MSGVLEYKVVKHEKNFKNYFFRPCFMISNKPGYWKFVLDIKAQYEE